MSLDLLDIIFKEGPSERETRRMKSLASLLNDGFEYKEPFVLKYEGNNISEVYITTKVGVCYSLTLEEYRLVMRERLGG